MQLLPPPSYTRSELGEVCFVVVVLISSPLQWKTAPTADDPKKSA